MPPVGTSRAVQRIGLSSGFIALVTASHAIRRHVSMLTKTQRRSMAAAKTGDIFFD